MVVAQVTPVRVQYQFGKYNYEEKEATNDPFQKLFCTKQNAFDESFMVQTNNLAPNVTSKFFRVLKIHNFYNKKQLLFLQTFFRGILQDQRRLFQCLKLS